MTVLGKILVFVNLVFSLVTAGLIVMVYTTRTNWNDAFTKLNTQFTALVASARADVKAAEDKVSDKDKLLQAQMQDSKALEGKLTAATAEIDRQKALYAQIQQAHGGVQANEQALTDELQRRKTEVENEQKLRAALEKKISDIDLQMEKLRGEKTGVEIQFKDAVVRNNNFQAEVEGLKQEIAKLRDQLRGAAPTTGPTPTPPPENLEGTITHIDPQTGLAQITPGSDAGIVRGAKLAVYHLDPRPEYLGDIEILSVRPHEAVGKLVGPRRGQIKVGDKIKP
jgi:hypothetical protein